MNKEQALHAFFASFGWAAYDELSVPYDPDDPAATPDEYITYEVATDKIGQTVYLSASLWKKHTMSWTEITQKAREIAASLGYGGSTIRYDDGVIYIAQGSPFAQRQADDDDSIRRIMLNFAVEYISAA